MHMTMELTDAEMMDLFQAYTKDELAGMLIQANNTVKALAERMQTKYRCPTCNGMGKVWEGTAKGDIGYTDCPFCHGSGWLTANT